MNLYEALQAVYAGKKVRCTNWTKDIYMELKEEKLVVNPGNRNAILYTTDEFEIYEEERQKVKRSQAIISVSNSKPFLTSIFYKDGDEIFKDFNSNAKILQFPAGLTIEVDE